MFRKKVIAIITLITLFSFCQVQAQVWTSGHYEILEGDKYWEIEILNDVTVDMYGGDVYRLAAYDTTFTNWYDGQMDTLWARDDSIVNIYGGKLIDLGAAEESCVYLYAYDITLDETEYILTGKYYLNDTFFSIDVHNQDVYSHIVVIPEPTTLLILSLGWFLLRKK